MITREQFEAHVRAQAEVKYPNRPEMPLTHRTLDDSKRMAYMAARMEHEWPLAEALKEVALVAVPENEGGELNEHCITDNALNMVLDALSHYTTKPIEP